MAVAVVAAKQLGLALLVGILLGWGVTYGLDRAKRSEMVGRAKVLQEQADTAYAKLADERARRLVVQDSMTTVIETERTHGADAEARAARAARARPPLVTVVQAALKPDTVARAAFDSLEALHVTEIAAKDTVIAAERRVSAAALTDRDAANALTTATEMALKASRASEAAWRAAQPGWLTRNGKWLGLAGVGLGFYLGRR